jgi:glycerophosphoryl diester phosphodiesterase
MTAADAVGALQVAAVYHGVLDAALMEVLRGQQKTVIPWTVDDHADITRMLELGVDGLVTNAPGLLRTALQAAMLQCTTLGS